MPSSKLESSFGLDITVPLVGACFLGLFGLALPKWVKAEAEGNSGTVSTISEVAPLKPAACIEDGVLIFGVEVITKSGVSDSSTEERRNKKSV